jgi:hypothetical protein
MIAGILVSPITLGAVVGLLIFTKRSEIIDGYFWVLKSAIVESSEWSKASTEQPNFGDGANSGDVDHLEMVLSKTGELTQADLSTNYRGNKNKNLQFSFVIQIFLNSRHCGRNLL